MLIFFLLQFKGAGFCGGGARLRRALWCHYIMSSIWHLCHPCDMRVTMQPPPGLCQHIPLMRRALVEGARRI